MNSQSLSLSDTIARIAAGEILSIAGPAALLAQLPQGRWIGGSTDFAMTPDGLLQLDDRLCMTRFPEATAATIRHLPTPALSSLATGYAPGGLSLILIPAFSTAHAAFALGAMGYPGLFDQPLMGWISGTEADPVGAVHDGTTGLAHAEGALVMHLTLPPGCKTSLNIQTPFTPSRDPGKTFRFPTTGFVATEVTLGSRTVNLARYIVDKGLDPRLPLVTNVAGTLTNVAIRSVDPDKGAVSFYAPVVAGAVYHWANPLPDTPAIAAAPATVSGCGDVSLHRLTGGTGAFTGPLSFGQIAYILLTQTVVTLDITSD